jgi:hypothetical protein
MFHHLSQSTAGKPLLLPNIAAKIAWLFLLIRKLLWHPPHINSVTPKVFVDDGICRSIADVQLVVYVSDSNDCPFESEN